MSLKASLQSRRYRKARAKALGHRSGAGTKALGHRNGAEPKARAKALDQCSGATPKVLGRGNAEHSGGTRLQPCRPAPVEAVMHRLAVAITGLELPAVEKISQSREEDPFQVTIATLLSARTQDATTYAASERLFGKAATPQAMAKLTVKQIEKLIYPVSFYRYKARYIKATCTKLLNDFDGKTPSTMDGLLTLPGVGRKTANLVLILAYESRKNICVDTHVHRIANRLGWVRTKTPDETEQALYRSTEARWWPYINLYLVTWGQNVCRPVYPRCPACAIKDLCPRVGVTVVSKTMPESYPLEPPASD
jgi:endonuclease III